MENFYRLEGMVKGFANHRRIEILCLLEKNPELSVEEVANTLDVNFKTVSAHMKRLAISGLILKRSDGKNIRHKVSDRGQKALTFLHKFP
jgi:predicted ArsR family transcriptional regulator